MLFSADKRPDRRDSEAFYGYRSATQPATIIYVPPYVPPPGPVPDPAPPIDHRAYFPRDTEGVQIADLDGEFTSPIVLE